MCDSCGCGAINNKNSEQGYHEHEHEHEHDRILSESANLTVKIRQDILHANNHQADHIREQLLASGIRSFNLMSSPGSGKTTLLERTIDALPQKHIAVVEGDLETENDAQRIRNKGASAVQITTGTTCHLDAFMVRKAIQQLDLHHIDYLFVENVGNLVCPASYDVGTSRNVVLLSATEGDDKPEKYPVMFHHADLVLITKFEAAELMNFDLERAKKSLAKVNSQVPVFTLVKTGNHEFDEFDKWLEFLANA